MRTRLGKLLGRALAGGCLLVLASAPALAQGAEEIPGYEVRITIRADGDLLIEERIDYDFGGAQRHGIIRTIPSRFYFDDVHDRVNPIEDVEVRSPTAPTNLEIASEGGTTALRVGDPDVEITGRHVYTITYRVEGALNGFDEHDELYWNAIGTEWAAPIASARVTVEAPAPIQRVTCYEGSEGSTVPCGRSTARGPTARFAPSRPLGPFEGLTVVVAIPKGAVPDPQPILVERWSAERAFAVTPSTVAVAIGVAGLVGAWLGALWWREGRDRRYVGSPVDQVLGTPGMPDEPVPAGEGDAEAPVEFAPPQDVRPGQVGTLLDERANVIDVTATIVDLAGRGFLVIHELPDTGLFSKTDWRLERTPAEDDRLLPYERKLLASLFRDGPEVTVSALKTTFAQRLHQVEEELYADAMRHRWFHARPDRVRMRWAGLGVGAIVLAAGVTVALAAWTHWGIVGVPLLLGGIALAIGSRWMPARTAAGTAMVRRIRGFRRVIETAETHLSRWAEQENVFTRYLPYAIVFGLTEKWAKAFEALGIQPDTSSWYVGAHPFTAAAFGSSIDSFAVTTGGTLASTPASSGSSGFGGGGFSGGGGGGGGGGSW